MSKEEGRDKKDVIKASELLKKLEALYLGHWMLTVWVLLADSLASQNLESNQGDEWVWTLQWKVVKSCSSQGTKCFRSIRKWQILRDEESFTKYHATEPLRTSTGYERKVSQAVVTV